MRRLRRGALALAVTLASASSQAYELYNQDGSVLNADLSAMYAWLSSQESYYGKEGRSTWQEGFVKYGFSGSQQLGQSGTLYGGLSAVSSATWGSGDAGGNSRGDERDSDWEDAYVGWKSGELISLLGSDGLDISVGRQGFVVGDAFVIGDNSFSAGDIPGLPDADYYNRGGGYYLGGRKAYDKTAILRLGGATGLRADLAYLDTGNPLQSSFKMAVANLEYNSDAGNLGLMYVRGLDVDKERYFVESHLQRDGMNLYSLRGSTSAGIENLMLRAELVHEDKQDAASAGYVEAAWAFSDVLWAPTLSYRYSRFSQDYDAMFNDFSRGYGTWFQGEVAGNFAGPFNSNAQVHHLGLSASPREDLRIGVLYFDFDSLNDHYGDQAGRELDFYAEWMPTPNYLITPTIGIYDPSRSLAQGGTQTADNKRSIYAQVAFGVFF